VRALNLRQRELRIGECDALLQFFFELRAALAIVLIDELLRVLRSLDLLVPLRTLFVRDVVGLG